MFYSSSSTQLINLTCKVRLLQLYPNVKYLELSYSANNSAKLLKCKKHLHQTINVFFCKTTSYIKNKIKQISVVQTEHRLSLKASVLVFRSFFISAHLTCLKLYRSDKNTPLKNMCTYIGTFWIYVSLILLDIFRWLNRFTQVFLKNTHLSQIYGICFMFGPKGMHLFYTFIYTHNG